MNVLSLLESDFIDICEGIAEGNINSVNIKFTKKASVCKYAVPLGYPDNPIKGKEINVSKVKNTAGLFYASVMLLIIKWF